MISARRASLLLVVACAAVAAGCGNPPVHHPSTGRAAAPPGSAGPLFRWLVRTQGPQPSVAEENRATGTTAWRLPGPRLDVGGVRHGAIAGYVAGEAVRPGDIERIYVDAPGSASVEIRVFRIGGTTAPGGARCCAAAGSARTGSLRARIAPPPG